MGCELGIRPNLIEGISGLVVLELEVIHPRAMVPGTEFAAPKSDHPWIRALTYHYMHSWKSCLNSEVGDSLV